MSLGFAKTGQFMESASKHVGKLRVANIGLMGQFRPPLRWSVGVGCLSVSRKEPWMPTKDKAVIWR